MSIDPRKQDIDLIKETLATLIALAQELNKDASAYIDNNETYRKEVLPLVLKLNTTLIENIPYTGYAKVLSTKSGEQVKCYVYPHPELWATQGIYRADMVSPANGKVVKHAEAKVRLASMLGNPIITPARITPTWKNEALKK